MKLRFVLTFVAGLSPAGALAGDTCSMVAQLAEVQMQNRQLGIPLDAALGTVANLPIGQVIVIDAWSRPRHRDAAARQQSVDEFRDAWFRRCLSALATDA
jgi:hypothetical protein